MVLIVASQLGMLFPQCVVTYMVLLVMMFKCQRQANIAMPVNNVIASECCCQILLCQCSRPVLKQKCTYGNMAESELFDTLL